MIGAADSLQQIASGEYRCGGYGSHVANDVVLAGVDLVLIEAHVRHAEDVGRGPHRNQPFGMLQIEQLGARHAGTQPVGLEDQRVEGIGTRDGTAD